VRGKRRNQLTEKEPYKTFMKAIQCLSDALKAYEELIKNLSSKQDQLSEGLRDKEKPV
jgi:hypothetical protein